MSETLDEQRLRVLIDGVKDHAILLLDPRGSVVTWTAQAERITGYKAGEIIGTSFASFYTPEDIERGHPQEVLGIAAEVGGVEEDGWRVRKDGSRFWTNTLIRVLRNEAGQVAGFSNIIRDTGERKGIEEKLRESEQRRRTLIEGVKDYAMLMLDRQGRVTGWTACIERIKGCKAEEIMGKSFAAFYTPEDIERGHPEEVLRIAKEEGHFEEEGWRARKDGSRFWASVAVTALRDDAGQVSGVSEVTRDITERKKTQEKLRESEQGLRALIESVKDYAILMLDPWGRVISWTACAERIKGYTAEEIIGKSFSAFYTPEDIERGHPEEVLRIAEEEGNFEEEGWRVRKDGSRFCANVMITMLRDKAGQFYGFSKITRDITERRRNEERLRESEQKFRAVLESAPDAVLIADEVGKIILTNAQAERLFGYRRDELVGQPVEILMPLACRSGHSHHRSQYSKSSPPRQMGINAVLEALRKDGTTFPAEVSLSPIETADTTWVAAAVRDVSERRFAELELIAARQRAEEANHAKSAFLAAMSHEIRTPMNAILGMSELLWESDLDPEQREFVEIFRRAGSKLLSLIDNILDLSKIEAGHLDLERQQFILEDILDQAIELLGGKARKKGIALLARLAPGLGTDFVGDPGRLRQVILNLVGNAVKFTESGEIMVTVQPQECGTPGKLIFAVSDTGIGIPPDKLSLIFEDFTQADSSVTRKYGGTGLGLGISRRIVEQMGGRLWATSSSGKGSTFRFTTVFEPVAPDQRVRREVGDFHGRRVLVVDESDTSRLILRETLGAWGLEANAFGTASEALADLARAKNSQRPYELVIFDDCLPDMDGWEIAASIKSLASAIPLIVLSSGTSPCGKNRVAEVGVSRYAIKPVKRAELLRMICEAVGDTQNSEPSPPPGDASTRLRPNENCPLRILVAEDSPDNRILVQAYLKGGPYLLTFAVDGQSAVDEFARQSFDIVLMDVQMPVMDGLTATRRIRELERERDAPGTPIVALTAHARQKDIEMSMEAGCDNHLSKPISKAMLLGMIEQYGWRNECSAPGPEAIPIRMPEGLEELVPPYLAARREEIRELTAWLAAADFERLCRSAHNLKGSGQSYGFPDLTRLGAALEKSAQHADAPAVRGLLAELDDYLHRVQLVS